MNNGYFFNRTASLILGFKGVPGFSVNTPLRIAFEISRTETGTEANQAIVKVNNLSDKTRALIKANEGMLGILYVGYEENGSQEIIFAGDVTNVTHNLTKPEVETSVTITDGATAIRQQTIAVSYGAGTTVFQIVNAAVQALGLPVVSFPALPVFGTILLKPFAFSGFASELMNRLSKDYGFSWSIQNGSIKLYESEQVDGTAPVKSVLIGSPRRLMNINTGFNGYEFDCLLLAKAIPGGVVNITSKEVPKGVSLQIAEVKHSGDTFGEKWTSTIKGRLVSSGI